MFLEVSSIFIHFLVKSLDSSFIALKLIKFLRSHCFFADFLCWIGILKSLLTYYATIFVPHRANQMWQSCQTSTVKFQIRSHFDHFSIFHCASQGSLRFQTSKLTNRIKFLKSLGTSSKYHRLQIHL